MNARTLKCAVWVLALCAATTVEAEPLTAKQERALKSKSAAAPIQIQPVLLDDLVQQRYEGHVPAVLKPASEHAIPLPLPRRTLSWAIELSFAEHWIAATAKNEHFVIALHGTTVSHHRPELQTEIQTMGPSSPPTIIQQHGITTVRFKAHNVGYFMVLQCRHAGVADHCHSPAFARLLFDELVFIGGQP